MNPAQAHLRKSAAVTWLVLCTLLWGLGFVATAKTLVQLHPLWSNALRFMVAAPISLAFFWPRIRWDAATLRAGFWAGLFLHGAFFFQTWGMQYTTVGKSSLITGLYAVITPLMAPLFASPRAKPMHLLAAVVSLLGLGLLSGVSGEGLNVGDLLTLGCPFFSAAHIHVVARAAPGRDPLGLNTLQLVVSMVVSIPLALALGGPVPSLPDGEALLGLLYLATFSSIIAFGIQLHAQPSLSPSTAAVLLLLESPFGFMSGVLLLHEPVTLAHSLGALVMLSGCGLAVWADARR